MRPGGRRAGTRVLTLDRARTGRGARPELPAGDGAPEELLDAARVRGGLQQELLVRLTLREVGFAGATRAVSSLPTLRDGLPVGGRGRARRDSVGSVPCRTGSGRRGRCPRGLSP